ncbi:MAG: 2-amino-4-oxopentanoate thiolase subunit OrtB [Actinobacteria bacterium]|nr:2-amino-4-oxopentanoate thiolase subunit OrtB [Actinomycetota bacterium]
MRHSDYSCAMGRKSEIVKRSTGIDFSKYDRSPISFDYDLMMSEVGYSIDETIEIQKNTNVGNTPLVECRNITRLVRTISQPGNGARIFIKDEAANPSGSFKDRRASLSVFHAKRSGYEGVISATSGNYGAAVASQVNKYGLKAIILQEVFDSRGVGQPEILEKGRACEAYGAEVHQMSVGPELFYYSLLLLEETGYFNASLYTPFSVTGIETLGYEIANEIHELCDRFPDVVLVTHAGGGNVTGTARGLAKAGAKETQVVAVSVDLRGLHMASDGDFNRKSFTTGHTGFGLPFATWPDRSDVPRNAARSLRFMDRYVLISQGEVFYATEMLAQLEGLQRGPAGNTSLAAAIPIASQMPSDSIVVVQETEYTGAGKHPYSQLTFARKNGIEVSRGNPSENIPGKRIVIPENPQQIRVVDVDLNEVKKAYIKNAVSRNPGYEFRDFDIRFIADDIKETEEFVRGVLDELEV